MFGTELGLDASKSVVMLRRRVCFIRSRGFSGRSGGFSYKRI